MLKLTYTWKSDKFKTVTVIGDAAGIRDLYWQLTNNYCSKDGTAIGSVKVTNLDGYDCTDVLLREPYTYSTNLSENLSG